MVAGKAESVAPKGGRALDRTVGQPLAAKRHEKGRKRAGRYLPREVFFGRFGFAGGFFPVWVSDFERFFPATSGSSGCLCSSAECSALRVVEHDGVTEYRRPAPG